MKPPINAVAVLMDKLYDFASGRDRSLAVAGEIELLLDCLFPNDDTIQDFVTYFAMYRPGSGEYLYDEIAMAKKTEYLIDTINILIGKN